jgi:hypothetical protein
VVAFISSVLVLALLTSLIFPMAKRRPIGTPLTWGEAMIAATYTFLIMFFAYGVVPHLWLTWADSELKWRPDTLLADYPFWGHTLGFLEPIGKGGPGTGGFPMTITMQTVRDIIAVAIYGIMLGLNMYLFAWWQKRGTKVSASTDVATSDYGRPLVKKAEPATAKS